MARNGWALLLVLALALPSGLASDERAAAQTSADRLVYTTRMEAGPGEGEGATQRIAVVDTATSVTQVLTDGEGWNTDPRSSPDGRWIAYTAYADGGTSVAVVRSTGGQPEIIDEYGSLPSWSPDGSRLVFTTSLEGDATQQRLAVVDVDTSGEHLGRGAPRLIEVPGTPTEPVFSPSGDAIAFALSRSADWWDRELWLASSDGSDARPLAPGLVLRGGRGQSFVWSPDGQRIALVGDEPEGAALVHLVRPDGSGHHILSTHLCTSNRAIAWEPFGRFLAVVSGCPGWGIQLIALDGEVLRHVVAGRGVGNDVVFAPDGWSLYVSQGGATHNQLLQVPTDGSAVRTLSPIPSPSTDWLAVVGPAVRAGPRGTPPLPPRDTSGTEYPEDPNRPPTRADFVHACPRGVVAPTFFRDVASDTRERRGIDCAVWWRMLSNPTARRFVPDRAMRRGQVATLLARLIKGSGRRLPPTARDCFGDDDTSVHERNINRLCAVGVISGAGRRFHPDALVRRGQMATMVLSAFEYAAARSLPAPSRDHFHDDADSPHHRNINRAADAEFVTAVDGTAYRPAALQRHASAAEVTSRFLDFFVERRGLALPRYGEAVVSRVVDGDTFIADVHNEDGSVSKDVRVRMAGINTPERGTCGAREARLTLKRGIEGRLVQVSAAHLDSVGLNNRPIRFVWVSVHGRWIDISHEMVRRGHALWMPHTKEPARSRAFNRTAREAAARGGGIWNPTACGVGPQQGAELVVTVRPDPPGSDLRNLNGERVMIRNRGNTAVDLGGWSLHDASPNPIYRFTAGTRVPAGATLILHVGSGRDRPLRKYWGLKRPLFRNPGRNGAMGDGAYLYDTDGDLRFWHSYPCPGAC